MFRFNHRHQGVHYSSLLKLLYACCTVRNKILIPNSVTGIHQLGPNNIRRHTTELTTTCFN